VQSTAPATTNLNVLKPQQMGIVQHLPAGVRRRRLIKVRAGQTFDFIFAAGPSARTKY
jgi:hypothetical protein